MRIRAPVFAGRWGYAMLVGINAAFLDIWMGGWTDGPMVVCTRVKM